MRPWNAGTLRVRDIIQYQQNYEHKVDFHGTTVNPAGQLPPDLVGKLIVIVIVRLPNCIRARELGQASADGDYCPDGCQRCGEAKQEDSEVSAANVAPEMVHSALSNRRRGCQTRFSGCVTTFGSRRMSPK